ncbi:MAG: AsmA family protein [Bacteroidetes bacterium]|nr:AsmA family protein [Bacteroidota bacterium]
MRRILRIGAWTIGSLLALFLLLLAFLYLYSDTIKNSVVAEVNKNLKAKATVGDIQLSAIEHFPRISVSFEQVSIEESTPIHDSALAKLEKVSLSMDLWDVLNKKYLIKGLDIENGYLSLGHNKTGIDNFSIFEIDSSKQREATPLSFEKISLRNVTVVYTKENDAYHFQAEHLICKGDFSHAQFKAHLKGDILSEIIVDSHHMFRPKMVHLNSAILVDQEKEILQFEETFLGLEDLAFAINGEWSIGEKSGGKIKIETRDAEIKKLLSLLPGEIKKKVKDYESSGTLQLKGSIEQKHDKPVELAARFSIDNGTLYLREFGEGLRGIRLSGSMNYSTKKEFIYLEKFEARLMDDKVNGSLKMDGFDDPLFDVSLFGDFNLKNIKRIIDLGDYNGSTGKLLADINLKGKLSELKNPQKYQSLFLDGKIKGEHLSIGSDSLKNEFSDVNAFIELKASICNIHRLDANWNGQKVQIQGKAENYMAYLFNEGNLTLLGRLKSPSLQFNISKAATSSKLNDTAEFEVPDRIHLETEVEIGQLQIDDFIATNILGRVSVNKDRLDVKKLQFESCNGNVDLNGNWSKNKDGKQPMIIHAVLQKVDINQLFIQLRNFGQDAITDKNLKGLLSGKVDVAFFLDRQFQFDSKSLYSFLDLQIEGGELNRYAPLKSLSKFVRIEDLENVKFNTLANQIEIRDEVIYIPSMEIQNSAMNLFLEGKHDFKNNMDYSIKIQLKDVMAGRYMKTHDEEDFQKEEDGIHVFVRMSGTPDKLSIRYDSKKARKNFKQEMKKEQRTVKDILKQEFGIDKKDPSEDHPEEDVPDWEDDIPE